jgi:hypothetical protein
MHNLPLNVKILKSNVLINNKQIMGKTSSETLAFVGDKYQKGGLALILSAKFKQGNCL